MRLFRRKDAEPAYVREAEELLRLAGWHRVSGVGAGSIWTTRSGSGWLPLEDALHEAARRLPPDRELKT
jgi:hypothetical protein